MPIIRDGRGELHVHDMGTPPVNPPGEIVRARVSEQRMADFAAERARLAQGARKPKPKPRSVRDVLVADAVAARTEADERRRQMPRAPHPSRAHMAVERHEAPKEEPVPQEHHDAGTNRVRQQVDEGRAASTRPPRGVFDRQATIEAVRTSTTMQEAAEKLGLADTSSLIYRLSTMAKAGELPDDVAARRTGTGSARRIPRGLPTIATAKPAHIVSTDSTLEGGEEGAPATAADDRGATRPARATEVATPPSPPRFDMDQDDSQEPAPGIVAGHRTGNISAPDSTPEAGGGPGSIAGEDRCSWTRFLAPTVLHICDLPATHDEADPHRGRLLTVGTTGIAKPVGHAVAAPA